MVNAPYGMCDKHKVPLEVLFHAPFCPMCEKPKTVEKDNCGGKGTNCGSDKCDGSGDGGGCADNGDCDTDDCSTCGGCVTPPGTGGWQQLGFPWAPDPDDGDV